MLESKRRAAIFLMLAFLLASIAGYLVFDKVRTLNAELGGMSTIYVAADSIPPRTLITDAHIKTMEIPNRYVTDSHITDKEKLINMVSVVPLNRNDIITQNMLKPATELRDSNNRLVAMFQNEKIQFDQVVTTNDRVDIIVSYNDNGVNKTEIFMRDVPVAWVNGNGEEFIGVALELKLEEAPKLIDMQNFATHIRVLKANVGKEELESYENLGKENDQQNNEQSAVPETIVNDTGVVETDIAE